MAVKSNFFSLLAGISFPSKSQKSLIFDEARAMHQTPEVANEIAEEVYYDFRNMRLFERYAILLGQDRAALKTTIRAKIHEREVEKTAAAARKPAKKKAHSKARHNKNALEVARRRTA